MSPTDRISGNLPWDEPKYSVQDCGASSTSTRFKPAHLTYDAMMVAVPV